MSVGKNGRLGLSAFAFAIFGSAAGLAIYLLFEGKLSGAEFTAFIIAFAAISLAVAFAPEVQEVSFVGNVVKLREVKAEAMVAIESLNESRVELLSICLSLALKHSGGFSSGDVIDPRNYHFWSLIDLAKKYQCVEKLKVQISGNLQVLMAAQIRALEARNDDVAGLDAVPFPTIFELTKAITAETGVEKASIRHHGKDLKPEIVRGLEEYLKMDQLRTSLGLGRDMQFKE